MITRILFFKLTFSLRPMSKYKTSLKVGVPWGIACSTQTQANNSHLTIGIHSLFILIYAWLAHCSQLAIKAQRRKRREGKLTFSLRPASGSCVSFRLFKSNSSAKTNLSLTQLSKTTMGALVWGAGIKTG